MAIFLKGDDPRYQTVGFHHFAKVGKDGTVLAIVEVAADTPLPKGEDTYVPVDHEGHDYVDLSEHYPIADHAQALRNARGR